MTTSTSFSEEESLNVYWKIKNFSFCYENIESPNFSMYGNNYTLFINHDSDYVEYRMHRYTSETINFQREISVLTCDNSPEISKSGKMYTFLRVPKDSIFGKRRNSFLPEDTLTVRYRFPTSPEKGKIFLSSEIGVKRKYFLWNHQSLSNFRCSEEKFVENSKSYGDIKLRLKSTDGFNIDKHLFIEIYRNGGERCYCVLKVSMLDLNGIAVNEVSDEFVFEKKDDQQTKAFLVPFKMNKLFACKNLLLANDTLSLKCNFAMSLGSLTDQTSVTSYTADYLSVVKVSEDISMNRSFDVERKNSTTIADLRADLKSILDDGTFFDVKLQVQDEVIKAHKNILSARSSVFRAMLTKDMRESIDSTIVIEDLDAETVRRLLLYIYTESVFEDHWENAKSLYYAADKYQLMGLKKKCVAFLKTNLSVSNVCETLLLADLHHDKNLKTSVLDFVSAHDSAVFDSEEWKEFERNHSTLANQAMHDIYSKLKQLIFN